MPISSSLCVFRILMISHAHQNHNPYASGNGPGPALDALGPIWPSVQITVLRTAFEGKQGWLNYRTNSFGEVVDRYRWEAGCIMEHVCVSCRTLRLFSLFLFVRLLQWEDMKNILIRYSGIKGSAFLEVE
jgi:hypothetical protein